VWVYLSSVAEISLLFCDATTALSVFESANFFLESSPSAYWNSHTGGYPPCPHRVDYGLEHINDLRKATTATGVSCFSFSSIRHKQRALPSAEHLTEHTTEELAGCALSALFSTPNPLPKPNKPSHHPQKYKTKKKLPVVFLHRKRAFAFSRAQVASSINTPHQ
jgi:hypothetical protein